jgi:hypothetical protein
MNEPLPGKIIQQGNLGNSPHKFVWYDRTHKEDDQVRIIVVKPSWFLSKNMAI